MYADEAGRLSPVFGASMIEMHHIGSTAVPGLTAKLEIDILAIVTVGDVPENWVLSLKGLGYRRGGDLSPGHHFFKRDVSGVRTHKLHVCRKDHPTAAEMIRFRNHLRHDAEDRLLYEQLKIQLEAENTEGIRQYLDGKDPFIRSRLEATR